MARRSGGFKVLSEIAGAGKWTLPFGKKGTKPLEDQDELLQTLADKVNLLLSTFQRWSRRVLLVIDGLDRIVDSDRAESRFLGEVFRRRVHDLGAEDIVPPKLLDKLAYYSGGRLRDFVKSIGMLAERGWDDNANVATEAHVDDVLKEARQLVGTGLRRGHIDVLKEVASDPDHRLPDGDLSRELLTYGRLLPYPNESEWFYPHPLLTLNVVQVP